MEGTQPQAQGRRPFMPQRRAGKSFILARSQEWAARPWYRGRAADSAGTAGEGGELNYFQILTADRPFVASPFPSLIRIAQCRHRRDVRGDNHSLWDILR